MKLDKSLPYATVTGHPFAAYVQGGLMFDGEGNSIAPEDVAQPADDVIETDAVDSAKQFLLHILKAGPLSKSAVYKVAQTNNQPWDAVKTACDLLGVVTFAYRNATMWKLPESVEE